MSVRPPRPRLTLRVGITGHRWDKLNRAHERELVGLLRGVLVKAAEIAQDVRDDAACGYRSPTSRPGEKAPLPPELRLVSALAEGSDRLLADAAPKGWRLQAILPFPPEGYRRDASEPDSGEKLTRYLERAQAEAGVLILDGNRDAEHAFEPVATAICLNSDVLIAIWNGAPGRRGGTAAVVSLAARLGIPIVRVAPDAGHAPWLHRPELPDQGMAGGLSNLEERLRGLLCPPPEPAEKDETEAVPDLREEYFTEHWRAGRRGQLFGHLIRMAGYSWGGWRKLWTDLKKAGLPFVRAFPEDYPAAIRKRWKGRWEDGLQLPPEFVEPILATPLPDHYGWASYLANYYAGRYRSSFLWGYVLFWIAVGCAAGGLAVHLLGYQEPWSVRWFAAAELFLLLAIAMVVLMARRGAFHERWLAYRSLTERLRSLTYTLPLGRASTLRAETGPAKSRSDSWVDWMHRAVVREVGVLSARMTPERLEQARRMLVDGELAEQVEYHRTTAERLMRVERRMHAGTDVVFGAAVLLAAVHVVESLRASGPEARADISGGEVVVGVLGLTAPALAAAVHGFLSQGEFKETAVRSRATERHLAHLIDVGRAPDAARSSDVLGGLAAVAAAAMDAELGAWFAAYQGKDVPLP